jgi:hypothetical protein
MDGIAMLIRTYSELRKLDTFEERYNYLKLSGIVGRSTFGSDRYLNQLFYRSNKRWKSTRDVVIIRDNGCDLGIEDYEISERILIHHMNAITIRDIELDREWIYDPEFLVCTSQNTHLAIHYSDESLLPKLPIERKKNDTCPWR